MQPVGARQDGYGPGGAGEMAWHYVPLTHQHGGAVSCRTFVPRVVGPGRQHRHAIVGRHLLVGGVNVGLVAVRAADTAAEVVTVLFPVWLCGGRRRSPGKVRQMCRRRPHNAYSEVSQLRSDSSERQMGLEWDVTEVPGGSHALRAACFVFVFTSA